MTAPAGSPLASAGRPRKDPADDNALQRPPELEDRLNRHVFHPLARRLALRLATTPITPNQVSVAGGLSIAAAAVAYAGPAGLMWPASALVGFGLHLGWHVLDGADGDLARLTGRSGMAGEIVDGICDYAGHIVLYLGLGALLVPAVGALAPVLVVSAGVSRIVQANHYEVQRRQYQWWVHGRPWLRSAPPSAASGRGEEMSGALAVLRRGYLALASRISRGAAPLETTLEQALVAAQGDPQRLAAVRAVVRQRYAPLLRRLSPLGANSRTVVLGLAMLAGSPLWFFLYEAVMLNLVLAGTTQLSRRTMAAIVDELSHERASTER